MANEQNRLNWIQLDKDDSINELIDKFNFNFSLFALNNGGMPGANGKDGDDSIVTYSRCAIHGINITDDSESEYNISETEAIKKINECIENEEIEDLQKYDIIIIGNLIYQYLDKNDYHLISKIYGKKGDKGDKAEASDIYFKPIKIENNEDNFYSLSLADGYKSIILDESTNVNPDGGEGIDNNVFKYSLIFPKNTDGITFLKDKTQVSTISHTSYGNGDGDIFRISDISSNGSIYESDKELILRSGREKKDNTDVDNKDDYKTSLSIMDGFTFNSDKKELKIEGTDISSNDIISIKGKDLKLETNSYSGKINLLSNIEVNNKTITVLGKGQPQPVVKISPDESTFNKIHADTITIPQDGTPTDITNIFAKLNGEFKQFVGPVQAKYNYTSEDDAKQELRRQIGATSEDDVDSIISNKLNNKTFAIYNYCPIGTILPSIINKGTWFKDNSNNVFVLCNGEPYTINKVKEKYILYIENQSFETNYKNTNEIKEVFGALCTINITDEKATITIPDLSNKFLYGTKSGNELGNTAGNEKITLNADNIPPHYHLYAGDEDMWNSDVPSIQPFKPVTRTKVRKGGSDSGDGCIYYTSTVGKGSAFNILPPYYKVFYYVKITDLAPPVGDNNNQTQPQPQQPVTPPETTETVIYDGSESDSDSE